MTNLEAMQQILDAAKKDGDKFYNRGNNAAGRRIRKAMQEIKALAQEIRMEITDIKNS